jgi:hypothetical protein
MTVDYRIYHAINQFVYHHAWLGRGLSALEKWGVPIIAVATFAAGESKDDSESPARHRIGKLVRCGGAAASPVVQSFTLGTHLASRNTRGTRTGSSLLVGARDRLSASEVEGATSTEPRMEPYLWSDVVVKAGLCCWVCGVLLRVGDCSSGRSWFRAGAQPYLGARTASPATR